MHYRLRVECWNEINNNPKVIINVNYFLYQDGLMPLAKVATVVKDQSNKASQGKIDEAVKAPSFYDVVNNQVRIVDAKKKGLI